MLRITFCALLLVGICSGQARFSQSLNSCGINNRCVGRALCNNTSVRRSRLNLNEIGGCSDEKVCCPVKDIIPESTIPRRASLSCGHRNVHGLVRSITSKFAPSEPDEAEFGEFPWIVAILEERVVPGFIQSRFHCGGSLIHPRVVLTAAHHTAGKKPENFLARAGEWEPHSDSEPYTHQDRKVKQIIVHDRYSRTHLTFDAALLILETAFYDYPHIKPICLPDVGTVSTDVTCFVAGWGSKAFEFHLNPTRLKKIDLKVHPTTQCNDMLKKTRLGVYYNLHSSMICAGGEADKDSCTGDGGSALMCPFTENGNNYYQAGIVSWGIGCGEADVPGVYASVEKIRPWIDKVFTDYNILE